MLSVRARLAEIGAAAFAEEYTRSRLMPDVPEETARRFARLVETSLSDAYIRHSGSIAAQDLRAQARNIAVPTLVLVGSHDVSTPLAAAMALQEVIPGAQLAVVTDANHLSNLDQAEMFDANVAAFLARTN